MVGALRSRPVEEPEPDVVEEPLRLPDEEVLLPEVEREAEDSVRVLLERDSEPERLEAPRPGETDPRLSEPRDVEEPFSRLRLRLLPPLDAGLSSVWRERERSWTPPRLTSGRPRFE